MTDPDPSNKAYLIGAIVALFCLLILSAFFSMSETAFSSFNKIKIESQIKKSRSARLVLKISSNYDRLISTILIGNNIVNIVMSSIATVLFGLYFKDIGPTIATVAVTIVVLIFGEVCPKSLAKEKPETIVKLNVYLLYFFYFLFLPISILLSAISRLCKKIFVDKDNTPSLSDEEFKMLVEDIHEDGVINELESDIITNTIEYGDLKVSDVMKRAKEVVYVKDTSTVIEVAHKFVDSGYSRLVVTKTNSLSTAYGIIHQKDLFKLMVENSNDLKSIIMSNPVIAKPNHKISRLLKRLQSKHQHLALVKDNKNKFVGIVTMENILEELVGDIKDETDN